MNTLNINCIFFSFIFSGFKSYMNIFFILHRCDPIPGHFLCENAVRAHNVGGNQVALLSDFYRPPDEEASPKCMYEYMIMFQSISI